MKQWITLFIALAYFSFSAQQKACSQSVELSAGKQGNSVTRAIIVGISQYQNAEFPNLKYPHQDAGAFAAFLKSRAGGWMTDEQYILLTDEHATAAQFSLAFNWALEESKPHDRILVYFSGYGYLQNQAAEPGNASLLFYDSPPGPILTSGYLLKQLREILEASAAQKSIRFFLSADMRRISWEDTASVVPNWRDEGRSRQGYFHYIQPDRPTAQTRKSGKTFIETASFGTPLLSGLLGLADWNDDMKVTARELVRFVKEYKKWRVSADNLLFIAYTAKEDQLSTVVENTLDQLIRSPEGTFSPIVYMESNHFEDSIVKMAGQQVQNWYQNFILSLKIGHMLDPPGKSAAAWYDSLLTVEAITPIKGHLRRRFAAALQDDVQQVLNAYLNTNAAELARRRKNAAQYKKYPQYLAKTLELLGSKNFMYRILQAKHLYFEGLVLRFDALELKDSALLLLALERQQEALRLEPEAAFIYNETGVIYSTLERYEEALEQYRLALEYSPTWGIPYTNMSIIMSRMGKKEEAIYYGKQGVKYSYWNPAALQYLGLLYLEMGDLHAADVLLQKAVKLDPQYAEAWYNLACLKALSGDPLLALDFLEKAFQHRFGDLDHLLRDEDLSTLRALPEWEELMKKYFLNQAKN